MPLRIILATGLAIGLMGSVQAQPKTIPTKELPRPAATLEQRLAALEQQAAKLLTEIQAIRQVMSASKDTKESALVEDIAIYRLRNVEAGRIVEVLLSILDNEKDLRIIPDAATNSILVRGSALQRKTIEAVLVKLDVEAANDVSAKTDFQIIMLKRAPAADAAKLLHELFRANRDGVKTSVAADPRTNSLVVQGRVQDLELIRAIVERLDSQPDAERGEAPPKTDKRPRKD